MNLPKALFAAAVGAVVLFGATALAGAQPLPRVSVDLRNVATAVAESTGLDADAIPTAVSLPLGIAAAACNVSANALAGLEADYAACVAVNRFPELDAAVAREVQAMTPLRR